MTMNTFRKYSEFWKHQESVHISCSERFVRLKCENPLKTPSVSYFQQQIIWEKKKHRKDCHLQHSCSKLYTVGKQEKFSTDCLDFPHPHHLRQLSRGGGETLRISKPAKRHNLTSESFVLARASTELVLKDSPWSASHPPGTSPRIHCRDVSARTALQHLEPSWTEGKSDPTQMPV